MSMQLKAIQFVTPPKKKREKSGDILHFYSRQEVQESFRYFRHCTGNNIGDAGDAIHRLKVIGEQYQPYKVGIQVSMNKEIFSFTTAISDQITANPMVATLFDRLICWGVSKYCGICNALYKNIKNPQTIPCGCQYCYKCAQNFFIEEENDDCPVCKQNITDEEWNCWELTELEDDDDHKESKYKQELEKVLQNIPATSILKAEYTLEDFACCVGRTWTYFAVGEDNKLDKGNIYVPMNPSKTQSGGIFKETTNCHFPLYHNKHGQANDGDNKARQETQISHLLHLIVSQVHIDKLINYKKIYVIPYKKSSAIMRVNDYKFEALLQYTSFVHSLTIENQNYWCYGPKVEGWDSNALLQQTNKNLRLLYNHLGVQYYDLLSLQQEVKNENNFVLWNNKTRVHLCPTNVCIQPPNANRQWCSLQFINDWITPDFIMVQNYDHKQWNGIFVPFVGTRIEEINQSYNKTPKSQQKNKNNRIYSTPVKIKNLIVQTTAYHNYFPTIANNNNNNNNNKYKIRPLGENIGDIRQSGGGKFRRRKSSGHKKCVKMNEDAVLKHGIGKFVAKKDKKKGKRVNEGCIGSTDNKGKKKVQRKDKKGKGEDGTLDKYYKKHKQNHNKKRDNSLPPKDQPNVKRQRFH